VNRGLIVVPVEAAIDCDAAAAYACAVSKQLDADVHFLLVHPRRRGIRATNDDGHDSDTPRGMESLLRLARARGVVAIRVVKYGRPVDVIPAYAQIEHATWIVVAARYGSRRGRADTLARTLARRSPCPVLVVPPDARPDAGTGAVFSEILSAVDFTVASALAMRSALQFARRAGSRVTALHVLDAVPNGIVVSNGDALRAKLTARLQSEVERESRLSKRVAALVRRGIPDRTILEVAGDIKADLIVMGNAPRGSFNLAIGSSASRRVVKRAGCPVLLVPSVAGPYDWGDRAWVQADVPLEMAVS
jgi:nucleotide-binding universal stress UspA family protein